MKRLTLFLLLGLVFSTAYGQGVSTGSINLFLGNKSLSSSDWDPVDSQDALGIFIDIGNTEWPVDIAIDLLSSESEKESVIYIDPLNHMEGSASTQEIDLGVRKAFDLPGSSLHPYVGGGVAIISATIDMTMTVFGLTASGSEDDSGVGLWLNGGFFVTMGEHFNLGLDLRYSTANADFGTTETVDIGGKSIGVLLGYRW